MKYDIIRFYDNKGNPRYPAGRADALWREDGVKTLENEFIDLYNRFDNVITNVTTNDEIVDARYDEVTQTTYTTLANRLKVVSTMLKGANTTKVPARWLGIEPKTDITEKLQYVLSDNDLKITIEFERDTWYKITNTIYIDTRKSRIDGNGCTFMGNMPDKSDCIFKITSSISEYPDFYPIKSSSQNPAMNTALQPIRNCFLMSEVLSTETNRNFTRKASGIGIDGYYDNGAKRKVSSINFENIAFYGLYKAIDYNSDCCYLNNFDKFTVSNCFYGVFMGTKGNDSGEKLGFSNGAFGSCNEEGSCLIFNSSKNYSVNFNNVSFDYNYKLIKAEYGTYYFNNCHFETNNELLQSDNDDFYWGELGATASILINNSRILLGRNAEKINKYVFNCKTTSDKSRQGNVVINNCVCNTYSEYWVNKGGIRVNNLLPMSTNVCVLPSPSVNIYADQYCRYDLNNLKSIHIKGGNNNVTDNQPTVITGVGYKFIHNTKGYVSEFLVKLGSGGNFKLGKLFTEITIPMMSNLTESDITHLASSCFTVSLALIDKNNNIIKQTPTKLYGGTLGSVVTIEQNILTGFYEYDKNGKIIQGSNGNQTNYNLFNPILSNCDIYLRVRTSVKCNGGSEFIMKSLKFIPCEV